MAENTGLGIEGILAIAKQDANAYDTAKLATDKVPFLSESIELEDTILNHDYLYGGAATIDQQVVFKPISGTIESYLNYSTINATPAPDEFISSTLLIGLAMGGAPVFDGGRNELVGIDDLDVFGTIAVDKGMSSVDLWETSGAFVSGFTISGSANEYIKLSSEIQAGALTIDVNSVNTPTTVRAMDDVLSSLLMFSEGCFRIGDQDGALASTDSMGISAFTLSYSNNLTEAQQATCDDQNTLGASESAHTVTTQPIKPVRNGFREVTFEFTVPRYEADIFMGWRDDGTKLQADFKFSDTSVETFYEFNMFMPYLKIEKVAAPVAGAEALTQTVTCRLFKINSLSDVTFTSGTAITGELGIETKDQRIAKLW